MPILDIINWILGGPDKLSTEAGGEVKAQRDCMIKTMRNSLKRLKLALPAEIS
jgi:hypothetical protein